MNEDILKEWLNIEFDYIANKLGFIHKEIIVSEELLLKTIRYLDYLSTFEKEKSVNKIICIIALMWEYVDLKVYDIRRIIIKFLSRVGYPTSAIIVDDEFDKENCEFISLNSVIDELVTTMNQFENEIIIKNKTFLLTNFQMKIWESLEKNRLIGISAPTSAGKSFVILLNMINKLMKSTIDIVYIVPTLSLVNQVTEDFNKFIKELKLNNCIILNSYFSDFENGKNYIYILTQEKVISAFSNEENAFQKEMILIVDEIQNIERIKDENDDRSKILFDILTEFRYKNNVKQIIIAGPRIEKIDAVGFNIFGKDTIDITTDICPVLNITYSIYKNNQKYYLKQYTSIIEKPIVKEIQEYNSIYGYGKTNYDEKFFDFLYHFINKIGLGKQNIIFSPTSSVARKIANSISAKTSDESKINDLVEYYARTIHYNYTLCNTIKKRVAYHHGKLPMHVRRTLERAISDKLINCVACTTTLMQGVNLPAQNIIIRNPHLYLRKRNTSAELSNYEMANLRGRAGRLLKDFIGRTYVLDETSFSKTEGYEQIELFSEVTKELPNNYEEKFMTFKEEISDVAMSEIAIDDSMNEYGYLVSYIRQSVLRYGNDAYKKMNNVGISLTKEQVAAIIQKLNKLTIPKEICKKNRYWDPFVLEKIYTSYTEMVPLTPFERGAQAKLNRMLKFLRDTEETKKMYETYIPKRYQKGSNRSYLVKLSIQWGKGEELSKILSSEIYNNQNGADKIEETIELLQNIISYKLPLLLKPIFDILNPESIFLACLQCGATKKIIREMIEIGIPRETSIYLYENYIKKFEITFLEEDEISENLRNILSEIYSQLPYWIQVQLDYLV